MSSEGPQKQYRGNDRDAARSADQRKQLDRGNPEKVEAAKRGGQNEYAERRLRCTGSAWSTEKKYMKRHMGTFDID